MNFKWQSVLKNNLNLIKIYCVITDKNKMSKVNYLQVIAVSLSFQIGMVLAIVRDFIVKKVKKVGNKENS